MITMIVAAATSWVYPVDVIVITVPIAVVCIKSKNKHFKHDDGTSTNIFDYFCVSQSQY